MKRSKIIILTLIPLIISSVILIIILIHPKETVIHETMRFYNCESVKYGGYGDDESFVSFTDKYLDIAVDIKVIQGIGSYSVEGTLKTGDDLYNVTNISCHYDQPGKYASVRRADSIRLDTSSMLMTDDLKHIRLNIESGNSVGIWTNAATLGDYKEEMKILYNIDL